MSTTAATIFLMCMGGGTAIKPDSAQVSGSHSGSYDYGQGQYSGTSYGTINGTRAQSYTDQVDIELTGTSGRIRLPRVVLPILRGGENGWFELRDLELSDRSIEAKAAINFINRPKVHIDRMSGTISISGKSGTYAGKCQKIDPEAQPQF
jgi:hypothetical protein